MLPPKAPRPLNRKIQSAATSKKEVPDPYNTSKAPKKVAIEPTKSVVRKQRVTIGKNIPAKTDLQMKKQAAKNTREAAIARKKLADATPAPKEAAAVLETEEPIDELQESKAVECRKTAHVQYYRKNFRGLTRQQEDPCVNPVLQSLATVPKVAMEYKRKGSESLRSEEDLNGGLSGDKTM